MKCVAPCRLQSCRRGSCSAFSVWPIALLAVLLALATGILGITGSLAQADETDATSPAEQLSPELRRIYFSGIPETLEDLRRMDQCQQRLIKRVSAVTVGLQIGSTQGTGVLISEDGYVLTAAHVAGRTGLEVRVIMPDGQTFRGITLGMNLDRDAALIKIEPQQRDSQQRKWPYAEMGQASEVKPGSWCMALGHPGGYQLDRQPVARFGRVLGNTPSTITTDCKLVGGDSGGPLFNMEGQVIGIHSRIGSKITKNLHVSVDAYRKNWTRLARGDSWGNLSNVIGQPVIGVLSARESKDARISRVVPASPAERAGIRAGDLITRFGTNKVETFEDLQGLVNRQQPGDEVTLEVVRGSDRLKLKVILGSRKS